MKARKYHMLDWNSLFRLKAWGGWGILNPRLHNIELSIKIGWLFLNTTGLINKVWTTKYLKNEPLIEKVRDMVNLKKGGSVMWNRFCKHFAWIKR